MHTIKMIDVGQGDSFVIVTASHEVIVIDCRRTHPKRPPPVIQVLERIADARGSADIDALCVSHPHYDHYSGMAEVFRWCRGRGGAVRKLVCFCGLELKNQRTAMRRAGLTVATTTESPPLVEFAELQGEIEAFKRSHPLDYVRGEGYQPVAGGPGWTLDVIGPIGAAVEGNIERGIVQLMRDLVSGVNNDDGDVNKWSCICALKYGDEAVLFTGDAPTGFVSDAWHAYAKHMPSGTRVRVVKLPHHGAEPTEKPERANGRAAWAELLQAGSVALLSYGDRNAYRHPSQGLLRSLADREVLTASTNPCATCVGADIEDIDRATSDEEGGDKFGGPMDGVVEVRVGREGPVRIDEGAKWRPCPLCNSFDTGG